MFGNEFRESIVQEPLNQSVRVAADTRDLNRTRPLQLICRAHVCSDVSFSRDGDKTQNAETE